MRRPAMDQHSGRAALIAGSPSPQSKSRALLERARERLDAAGFETTVIELGALPAEALLGRKKDARVEEAKSAVGSADIVVAASPVYRATYSGLLKVFFDLFPQDALAGGIGGAGPPRASPGPRPPPAPGPPPP